MWRTGLVAPQHVGSSWTRARTCVPCIGRQTPNRCATREVPQFLSFFVFHDLDILEDYKPFIFSIWEQIVFNLLTDVHLHSYVSSVNLSEKHIEISTAKYFYSLSVACEPTDNFENQ